jgi:hypothetical protein
MVRRAPAFVAMTSAALLGLVGSTGAGAAGPGTAGNVSTHLGAVLVGGNEVPDAGDPDGYGFADVRVQPGKVCWRITVTGVDPIAAAHVHAGPAGVAGPVVVPLQPYQRGCVDVRKRTARFIAQHSSQFYVNVHNDTFPAGALRGQLLK